VAGPPAGSPATAAPGNFPGLGAGSHSARARRERLWASQMDTQQLILRALGAGQPGPHPSFQDRVTVAACPRRGTKGFMCDVRPGPGRPPRLAGWGMCGPAVVGNW